MNAPACPARPVGERTFAAGATDSIVQTKAVFWFFLRKREVKERVRFFCPLSGAAAGAKKPFSLSLSPSSGSGEKAEPERRSLSIFFALSHRDVNKKKLCKKTNRTAPDYSSGVLHENIRDRPHARYFVRDERAHGDGRVEVSTGEARRGVDQHKHRKAGRHCDRQVELVVGQVGAALPHSGLVGHGAVSAVAREDDQRDQ